MSDAAEGFAGCIMGLLGFCVSVLITGFLFAPVVKTHCAQQVGAGNPAVIESSWHLSLLGILGAGDGVQNDEGGDPEFCVRNTPSREFLGAIGVWPLGTPEEQVRDAIQSRISQAGD